ncbi:YdcF family protein [Massilia sp. PAMC28688]|uniref:YdcF family protein n=1 Tax=Massilia sp. PAMC28688 TaxID=2861283 RepID=UPI001C636A96|nr:YdcF family protein [Massilia sp. PAMC28688]QYF94575.1 YdcF family protein [Massilia sp. PAMC28688]
MRRAGRLLASLVLLIAACAAALLAAGTVDDARASDVAIVLGSKVDTSGQPSARLAARLDQGAAVYRRGLARAVIVSGGTGQEGFDEALVMRNYLIKAGLPPAAIIMDPHGVTTEATARNSAAIMQARGWTSAIVVTQHFHVPRTVLALRRAGVAQLSSTYPRFTEARDLYSTLRELVALPVYWLFSH